jgi:hypothetical protein
MYPSSDRADEADVCLRCARFNCRLLRRRVGTANFVRCHLWAPVRRHEFYQLPLERQGLDASVRRAPQARSCRPLRAGELEQVNSASGRLRAVREQLRTASFGRSGMLALHPSNEPRLTCSNAPANRLSEAGSNICRNTRTPVEAISYTDSAITFLVDSSKLVRGCGKVTFYLQRVKAAELSGFARAVDADGKTVSILQIVAKQIDE